jgi:hypothetical protein
LPGCFSGIGPWLFSLNPVGGAARPGQMACGQARTVMVVAMIIVIDSI